MLLIGDHGNRQLSEKVADKITCALFYPDVHVFPDGEIRIRITENVAGKDILLLKSTPFPVNDNIIELCFTVDALKKNGAGNVTAIIPYLGYSRADHMFRQGEGVPLETIIKTVETSGLDKIMIADPHSIRISNLFRIPVISVSAAGLFRDKILQIENDKNKITLVSPDMGGIRRIRILSELLGGVNYITINKERDLETGKIKPLEIIGEPKDVCFIVDDMIASGETMIEAVNELSKRGIKDIYALATHPVFVKGASALLQNSKIKKVFVTDTINIPEEKRFEKLEVLSIAGLIATSLKI